MSDKRRQQYLIDNEVQIDLVWQAIRFWFLCVIAIGLFLCIGIALFGEQRSSLAVINELFLKYGPAAAASIIVMPLVLMDIFRHSNRFAGPIFRMRNMLKRIANGERVGKLKFRDDDYWQELAEEFNQAIERLQGPADENAELTTDEADDESEPLVTPVFETKVEALPAFPVIPSIATTSSDTPESSPTMVG